ncbi:GGDEF domain-containing phosphodiesterase [Acidomonas methanolica]|uniref:GGDEF domain-containing phosphodiesterase n=1 Tax=Acidomonas methanolica TaxID=437 RepID=UPI002119ED3A|nr:GGDEF domain-containing phosphodiesterase [Acidomonas methanolica]MCQ9154519.1 EAL domain-containing protein [Acidomonas methanolica]
MTVVKNAHATLLAALRTVQHLSSCRFAAFGRLYPDGTTKVLAVIGEAPTHEFQAADLRRIATSPKPVAMEHRTRSGWTIGGVSLALPEERVTKTVCHDFLLVACDPGDPLEAAYLAPLEDVARLVRPHLPSNVDSPSVPVVSPRTRLRTRNSLLSSISEAIQAIGQTGRARSFGFMRVALDSVVQLNALYGWDLTDLLIDEMITRVLELLPQGATVTYCGGGAIAVMTAPGTSQVFTRSLVTTILEAMHRPMNVPDGERVISVSIGWAIYPQDGDDAARLDLAAQAALAEAKRHGDGHAERATREIVDRFSSAAGLETDLLQALAQDAFTLHWMPIVSVESQNVVSLEALLRWHRPGHGPVPAEDMILCAEEAGIIEQIDGWVLREACKVAARWSDPLRVSVNISPLWLSNGQLAPLVSEVLSETGLAPGRLQIELSDRRSFGARTLAFREISRLRALGVRVALDDFGAGMGSLERLGNLPIDQIKLDRCFLSRLNENPRMADVLRSLLQFALTLSVSCCAKGVETERERAFLEAYGCDEIQGYLLGSPVAEYASLTALSL